MFFLNLPIKPRSTQHLPHFKCILLRQNRLKEVFLCKVLIKYTAESHLVLVREKVSTIYRCDSGSYKVLFHSNIVWGFSLPNRWSSCNSMHMHKKLPRSLPAKSMKWELKRVQHPRVCWKLARTMGPKCDERHWFHCNICPPTCYLPLSFLFLRGTINTGLTLSSARNTRFLF